MKWLFRPRRRAILVVSALVVVLAVAAAAVFALTRPGNISHPNVEFQSQDTTPPPPAPTPPKPRSRKNPADDFVWPLYGYTEDRRRDLPSATLRPPYRWLWTSRANAFLEFPPVMAGPKLYQLDNDAVLRAIGKKRGRVRWKRRLGTLAASSPAYGGGRLYVTILTRAGSAGGRVAAVRASDGKILWSRNVPSRTESSPLLDHGRVYFGSEDGTVYALNAANGHVKWTYKAAGAVKGGLALSNGTLYFGDYAGNVYALRRADGHQVWRTGTSGSLFGLSSGQFYSTPAVAFGRVFIGNTDHYMYSFGASHGQLAWRTGTGGYVYSSPAVARVGGGRPMAYAGSYDGTFYAFDARSGKIVWRYHDGGTISGGSTIVGDIVYFSNNHLKTTTGLDARTGRRLFHFAHGAFNPVVSDGECIYLTGSGSLYQLCPRKHRG
jgi:outer membrane protein assembly factor BamB